MPQYAWLVSAVIAYVILFLLVDWKRLKYTIWGGIIASIIQIAVDTTAMKMNLYRVESIYNIWGSSVFFTFGVVFAIGLLFTQTLPSGRLWQGLNILVLVALFSMEEYLYIKMGVLEYINWNHPSSIFINLLVFTSLTWLVDTLRLNRMPVKRGI